MRFCVKALLGPALLLLVGCAETMEKYTVNSDGTVSDNETGLTWQHFATPGLFTRDEAIAHCRSLRLANTVWSLPTLDELLSIREAFPEQPRADFWTSDPLHQGTISGKPATFGSSFAPSEDGSGGPDITEPHERLRARCVNHIK